MAFSSLALAITLAGLYTGDCSPATLVNVASGGTFSVDLIHRDSIKSPFYDSSMNSTQRLGRALQRSFINAKRYKSNPNLNGSRYETQVIPDHGEFLMNVSFGNPSHKVLAIADTGSDLSWVQCNPCIKCYKHKGSIYNPNNSSTYKALGCDSTTCKTLSTVETICSNSTNICEFSESYADGSFSNGSVSIETIGLGDRALPEFVFGCSNNNDGVFRPTWEGIIGLGGGEFSLVTQIRSFVTSKFSYCLIPYPMTNDLSNMSSKLIFGDIDFGPNAVSTPLVPEFPNTFYYVTLEGISVGDMRLDISDGSNSSRPSPKGNMIVDSGTTLTMLPHKLHQRVEMVIKGSINLRTMKDPQKQLSLCYRAIKLQDVPKVTFHFKGADVELSKDNLFVMVSKHITCLAFAAASDTPVFGNLAQINFLVGYDLDNKMVSFKPTDCTKLDH